MKMSENSKNVQPSVLVLADFSDGKWHATSFAMHYLYKNNSSISILQTYQKPNFGHFMVRNIVPRLKGITEYELKMQKREILENYKIKSKNINTLSLIGELNMVLLHGQMLKGTYNIVLGTHASFVDSCTMQNRCLAKIIDSSTNPLFILPQEFKPQNANKVLFVGNPSKVPSMNVTKRILEICKHSESELDVLFVAQKQNQIINEDVKLFIDKHFNKINYSINYTHNRLISKGVRKYIKKSVKDLIIVERSRF